MKKFLCIIGTILIIVFIWHNSLLDATHSDADSLSVAAFVQQMLTWLGLFVPATGMDNVIRKVAHVAEFAALGCALSVATGYFPKVRQKRLWVVLAIGLLVAGTDEFLQLFSPGRGCQLMDVGIDEMGVLIGCIIGYAIKK